MTVRIGILGAARIAPGALIIPAQEVPEADVVAVAARDRVRAEAFAREHGLARALDYDALLRDPDIDAVYIALPTSLHATWTIAALRAGKHVLCEKPIASNAHEAATMAKTAAECDRLLVEAFHYRYHPLAERIATLLREGAIGPVEHVEAVFCTPIPDGSDIRYRLELSGGALMDLGCYAVHWLRLAAGAEPEVMAARARQSPPGIDIEVEAELRFPGGGTARLHAGMDPGLSHEATLTIRGRNGELHVDNPLSPHEGHALVLRTEAGESRTTIEGETTYRHQLRAFVDAVKTGTAPLTSADDAVVTMRVIDAIYRAARMSPRG